MPRGYGIAWACLDRAAFVALPVPLNVLACWLRAAWRWLRFPPGHAIGIREAQAHFDRGYSAGGARAERLVDAEYRRGVADGRNAVWRDLNAAADAAYPRRRP